MPVSGSRRSARACWLSGSGACLGISIGDSHGRTDCRARQRRDWFTWPRREDMAAVSLLSDHWPAAELQSIIARNAQGDHFTLSSIAAMLKELAGVHVDVLVFDWRDEAFDVIVRARAPDIYGVRPTNRLRLAYTGAHYLSVVRWSPSLPCKPPSPSNSLLHPSRYTTPSLPPAPARPQQRIQAHAVNWSLGSSHFGKCSVGSVPSEHPQARTSAAARHA